jgi:dipeptidyl aminopeptidase/acylaminoacyl peptidase
MRAGWSHFLSEYPEVDPSRVGAIGGSWGGYAVNLIQGHPEWGFGFKGLVSHDGDFDSVFSSYEVDEQTIVRLLVFLVECQY